jgi:hypothetical protein
LRFFPGHHPLLCQPHRSRVRFSSLSNRISKVTLRRPIPGRASEEFGDKLGHIEGAALHHIYEEEGTSFLELAGKGENQDMPTRRFQEEFEGWVRRQRSSARRV